MLSLMAGLDGKRAQATPATKPKDNPPPAAPTAASFPEKYAAKVSTHTGFVGSFDGAQAALPAQYRPSRRGVRTRSMSGTCVCRAGKRP